MRVSFSKPVQTGLKAHTAYRAMDIVDISSGVKRPGFSHDRLPPHKAKVKERVEIYFYPFPPSVPSWQVVGLN